MSLCSYLFLLFILSVPWDTLNFLTFWILLCFLSLFLYSSRTRDLLSSTASHSPIHPFYTTPVYFSLKLERSLLSFFFTIHTSRCCSFSYLQLLIKLFLLILLRAGGSINSVTMMVVAVVYLFYSLVVLVFFPSYIHVPFFPFFFLVYYTLPYPTFPFFFFNKLKSRCSAFNMTSVLLLFFFYKPQLTFSFLSFFFTYEIHVNIYNNFLCTLFFF